MRVLFIKKSFSGLGIFLFTILLSYIIIAPFQAGTVSVDVPTPGQNISGNIILEVTIGGLTDNVNVSNVSFFFNNGTGPDVLIDTNTSINLTSYTIVWDTTAAGVGDGSNMSINATAVFINSTSGGSPDAINTTSNFTLDNFNFTVDNTAPVITLNAPADNLQTNGSAVTFNFTPIDAIFTTLKDCNLTLDPANSTGGANINDTVNVANGSDVIFINVVPDGDHFWNVTCTDNIDTNNIGSAQRSFGLASTASEVTVDLLDSADVSKTTFGATDIVTIACTRKDDDGYNLTVISVSFPQDNSFATQDTIISSPALNASNTVEFNFKETEALGDYIARCKVTDVQGNSNQTNKTFTIEKKVKESTSAFSNKESKRPVAKVKISAGSTSEIGRLRAEGFSRLMQEGATVKFDVEGEEHSLTIKELGEKEIIITVSSTPFDVTIKEGESKQVDPNKDGKNDIAITFHKKFGKHADLTIALLSDEEREEQEKGVGTKKVDEGKGAAKASSAGALIVTLIVIVVITIIGYTLIKGKRK